MSKTFWLTDRSRIEDYHNCKRLRYLRYHWDGTGLERTGLSLPLVNGSAIHAGFARLLGGEKLEDVVEKLRTEYLIEIEDRGIDGELLESLHFLVKEQLFLLEGLVRAWAKVRLPLILQEYDVISIEEALEWEMAPGIKHRTRVDALLRRKADGLYFTKEFKSTSEADDWWAKRWEHNSQILVNTLVVEEVKGIPIEGVLIEGVNKGIRKVDTAKRSPFYGKKIQMSPLCYGWEKDRMIRPDYLNGALRVAAWESYTSEEWVGLMAEVDLDKLFTPLNPIRALPQQMERWKNQTIYQERMIQGDLEPWPDDEEGWTEDAWYTHLDQCFPMNDDHCYRYKGYACPMESLCFNEQVKEDPLGSGLYQRRKDHHA